MTVSHDMNNIRILKTCEKPICRALELSFNACIFNGVFPSEWKKGNGVAIHKKNDRQCLESYHPVSLLPICGKIVLIFNKCSRFFIKNGAISQNQSGFKPGDSYVNQILSVAHEVYESFDDARYIRSAR